MTVWFAGFDQVVKNLNKAISEIEGKTLKGLIRAAIIVRRDMESTAPVIPVGETGNLRSSFFTVTSKGTVTDPGGGFKGKNAAAMASNHASVISSESGNIQGQVPKLTLGFSANYAVYVHENIGANFKRPGAGAMFFSAALNRNHKRILEIIKEEAKIK